MTRKGSEVRVLYGPPKPLQDEAFRRLRSTIEPNRRRDRRCSDTQDARPPRSLGIGWAYLSGGAVAGYVTAILASGLTMSALIWFARMSSRSSSASTPRLCTRDMAKSIRRRQLTEESFTAHPRERTSDEVGDWRRRARGG